MLLADVCSVQYMLCISDLMANAELKWVGALQRRGVTLIKGLAVIMTPFGHAQKRLDQHWLCYELGTRQEAS